jgi:hypothetical protein
VGNGTEWSSANALTGLVRRVRPGTQLGGTHGAGAVRAREAGLDRPSAGDVVDQPRRPLRGVVTAAALVTAVVFTAMAGSRVTHIAMFGIEKGGQKACREPVTPALSAEAGPTLELSADRTGSGGVP